MKLSDATLAHKQLCSVVAPTDSTWAFGSDQPAVANIDNFANKPKGYDHDVAYVMSIISAWAYSDADVLAAKLRYYGVDGARIRQVAVVNNALFVVATGYLILSKTGGVGVLAFRGTDPGNIITWLTDVQVFQRHFFGAQVHSGFYANVQAVWEDVVRALYHARNGQFISGGTTGKEELTKPQEPLKALYVTGHSLGGAMAVLAAARLFQKGFEKWKPDDLIRGVYTFGQPMVGDASFVQLVKNSFEDRLYRHVYRDDVVPHLPPEPAVPVPFVPTIRYEHVGDEWRAQNLDEHWSKSSAYSGRANIALAAISSAATAIEQRLFENARIGLYSLDDHMPSNYADVSKNPPGAARASTRGSRAQTGPVGAAVNDAAKRINRAIVDVEEGMENAVTSVENAVTSLGNEVSGTIEKLAEGPVGALRQADHAVRRRLRGLFGG